MELLCGENKEIENFSASKYGSASEQLLEIVLHSSLRHSEGLFYPDVVPNNDKSHFK
jgi:hypothetical protein